nr:TonB-dependent receptor [Flavisolibacter sp.]
ERVVQGKVTDSQTNLPLPGASISIKGSRVGATTNAEGEFTLNLPNSARVLVVSSVGYSSREITIGTSTNLDVSLTIAESSLDEVVVVAYGQQQRRAVTGAISSVSAEKIQRQQVVSVTQALQGLAAGVLVINSTGQPGDNPVIRIRGIGSVNASADPLIVVDGIPFAGNLNTLNPNDIESMNVLKDATATALYGSRAANGVILITTKTGRRGKAAEINAYSSYGVSSRAVPEYPYVSAEQYIKLAWEAQYNTAVRLTNLTIGPGQYATNNLIRGTNGLQYNPYNVPNPIDTNGNLVAGAELLWETDWTKEVANNSASRKNVGVGVSGGAENIRYYLSADYLNQDGYIINSNFKRITARLNTDADLRNWLKVGLNMTVSNSNQNYPDQAGTAFRNAVQWGRLLSSIYPLHMRDETGGLLLDADGKPQFDFGSTLPGRTFNHARPAGPNVNAVAIQTLDKNLNDRLQTSMNTFGEVKFNNNFSFRSNLGVDRYVLSTLSYNNPTFGDAASIRGRVTRSRGLTTAWTWNNMVNYNQSFGEHTVGAMVSTEAYDFKAENISAARTGFPLPNLFEIGAGSTLESSSSSTNHTRLESYLGRATYNFANKYFLEGTLRRDGSTRFLPEKRWGTFYAVGASWVISGENFMSALNAVSYLKLRASYGEVGNNEILVAGTQNQSYFPYLSDFSTGWNNLSFPGVILGGLGNPDITWEKLGTYNIGLDFTVLNNRINGSVEYYNKNTFDLIFPRPLPASSGVASITENIGKLKNSGIEVSLTSRNFTTRNFTWETGLNFATLKNEITKLPQEFIQQGAYRLEVGRSLNEFYIYEWAGVDANTGEPQWYADEIVSGTPTGKKIIVNSNSNATRYYYGTALPKITGGFNSNMNFKSFDFSFLINFAFGGKVLDTDYIGLMHGFSAVGRQLHTDILNRWQKPGDVTDVPKLTFQNKNYGDPSTRHLFSGDYARLRNITIGYSLPATILQRQNIATNFRFYVQADNMLTWVKDAKRGMDPELNLAGQTGQRSTTFKTISAGLNIGF